MTELILEKTALAQWRKVVCESQRLCQTQLSESIESYLVMMLARHSVRTNLAQKSLGVQFLTCMAGLASQNRQSLQLIGDESLIIAGLFPRRALRRRVKIDYYVNIGQAAYQQLSHAGLQALGGMFDELSCQFKQLVDILRAIRPVDVQRNAFDLFELWQLTQSKRAFKVLQNEFGNISVLQGNNIPKKH